MLKIEIREMWIAADRRISLESFFGGCIRFRLIILIICAFRYVALGRRIIEFARTMRTRNVIRCITWRRRRQIRQLSTIRQMFLHFFRTANGLNEFLVFASPVSFLSDFRLLLSGAGTCSSFNIRFGFGSLMRKEKIEKTFDTI